MMPVVGLHLSIQEIDSTFTMITVIGNRRYAINEICISV